VRCAVSPNDKKERLPSNPRQMETSAGTEEEWRYLRRERDEEEKVRRREGEGGKRNEVCSNHERRRRPKTVQYLYIPQSTVQDGKVEGTGPGPGPGLYDAAEDQTLLLIFSCCRG
jgi:hypothetical protein